MHGEKDRWELNNVAACCLEQILKTVRYKTSVIRPLSSHLTNNPSKTNKTCWYCWKSKDELISDVVWWTPTHGSTNVGWLFKNCIDHLYANTGDQQEDLPSSMTMSDWWWERKLKKSVLLAHYDDDEEEVADDEDDDDGQNLICHKHFR